MFHSVTSGICSICLMWGDTGETHTLSRKLPVNLKDLKTHCSIAVKKIGSCEIFVNRAMFHYIKVKIIFQYRCSCLLNISLVHEIFITLIWHDILNICSAKISHSYRLISYYSTVLYSTYSCTCNAQSEELPKVCSTVYHRCSLLLCLPLWANWPSSH